MLWILVLITMAILLVLHPWLDGPTMKLTTALDFQTNYHSVLMRWLALGFHGVQVTGQWLYRGLQSPYKRYQKLRGALQKSGFWFSIGNAFFLIIVFRPDLFLYCLLTLNFDPLLQLEVNPRFLIGSIFGSVAAIGAFYHTFFVDLLKGQHHYEHVLNTTLETALGVKLPDSLQGESPFEHYASTRKLAQDGMDYFGGVDAAFELFCFHLLSGTLTDKCLTKHRGAAFYFFLCAHSPNYDTDWYAYSSLVDANRNPAGKSSLISAAAELFRAIAGYFWNRPDVIHEGLWAIGKKFLIIVASLKPRLVKIWRGREMRVDFLRQERTPLPKPDWLVKLEARTSYQRVSQYLSNLYQALAHDLSLVVDQLYASVAIYSLVFIMPSYFQDAWHEMTHGATDTTFIGLRSAITYNLTHDPIAIFTLGMVLFLPMGYIELLFLSNQDPPVENPDQTYTIDNPVSWVPLYVLKDIAGEGEVFDQYKRLAAIITDGSAVELAGERLGIGSTADRPTRLFRLVLGKFLPAKRRSKGDNPVRAYISELESLLNESKQVTPENSFTSAESTSS